MTYGARELGIGVALLLGGAAIGRFAAPRRVVEKAQIVTVSTEAKRDEARTAEFATAAHEAGTRTIIRYRYRPDGSLAERKETAETVDKSAASSARGTEQVRTQTRDVAHVEYRERLVERAGADWGVTGRVESRLLVGERSLVPGVSVERRIAGPVWAVGSASLDGRVGVGVRVEF